MTTAKKKKIKKIVIYAVSVIALVGVIALIGNLSNGFQNLNPKDWDVSIRNEDNLILVDTFEEKVKSGTGVTVEAKNGVLTLKGKNGSTTDDVMEIGKITLPAGTYRFTTAADGVNDKTSRFTYYMCLTKDDGATKIEADGTGVIEIAAEAEYSICVVVASDESVDGVKLYPMIVEGESTQNYYGNSDKDD